MKLRILSALLDLAIWAHHASERAYLFVYHAHAAALPRRAGEAELFRRSVEIDYEALKQ